AHIDVRRHGDRLRLHLERGIDGRRGARAMMRVTGWRRFLRDRRGSAGIEFGIIAPVLGLILGGAVDLGGVVFVKFRLDNAVSAGANYALVRGADVSAENGQRLAGTIAAIITSSGAGAALTG